MPQSTMNSLEKAAEMKAAHEEFCDPYRKPLSFAAALS